MKRRVLILCTGNSARSQMAEGLMRHFAGGSLDVSSAGIHPKGVNPLSIQVMNEIGIDISKHESKDVGVFQDVQFDVVITVCDHAKESCPVFPGSRKQHWSTPDPDTPESFRRVRDLLQERVKVFIHNEFPSKDE